MKIEIAESRNHVRINGVLYTKHMNVKNALDKAQSYLSGLCVTGVDMYESGYGSCIRDIAVNLGMTPDYYGTPNNEEDE